MTKNETVFSKDLKMKRLTVVRMFDAGVERVWEAWTTSEILDQWWAPKPYKSETKTMDFKEGGRWLYCMVGPGGDRTWCRVDFKTIRPLKKITDSSMFSDEEGRQNPGFPVMHWNKQFNETGDATTVSIDISFDQEADMEAILKMGFQEGFTMGLGNLDLYLDSH